MSPPAGPSDGDLERLFPGDSEMAGRMRAFDWSTSDLGPTERWPENLRLTASVCLTSRFPILLWWGPNLSVLYNDAYIPFLGETKHPRALGLPGQEVWAEIWDEIGPMLEGVRATGRATWSDDFLFFFSRKLPREEVHVRFTFGPILSADGRTVDGIFCPCTEITAEVVGARRLETLHKLGVKAPEARTVGAACRDAARVLGENPRDVPFAAMYVVDEDGARATLAATAGIPEAGRPLPSAVSTEADDPSPWPLEAVLHARRPEELDLGVPGLRIPGTVWPEPAERGLVLPIAAATQEGLAGLLVVGVSPRQVLDAAYRTFFDLVAACIATAISDAHAYEAERRRAEALAEIDRAKTAFFSNLSHEFRTPLTLMLGPVEDALADPDTPLPPEHRERLETARRGGLRLLKLVNSVLDFSRIEAGRARVSYEPTDLPLLTAELASNFDSACERVGLRLVVDCPPLPGPVYVDRDMWEKVVLNLVSNAFKFTFEGEIRVRLRAVGDLVELAVRDTGIGIPPEQLPRVFERFHRVEGAGGRTHEGTGIGLSLVEELVRLHGGSVRAESRVGRGSTFRVTIPVGSAHLPADRVGTARTPGPTAIRANAFVEEALRWLPDEGGPGASWAAAADSDRGPSPGVPARHDGGAARPRVLWADDNADMRRYVSRLLGERYEVQAVADGEAAWAAALAQPPDLMLVDVMMPRLDGLGLMRRLRADPRTRTIPAILLSARAGEESRVEGLEAGADDFLVKPFGARELLARIAANIEMHQLRREASRRERELLAETRAARERLEAVLRSISDGFIGLDRDWRYATLNDRALEGMGMSPQEVLGRRIWELYPDTIGTPFETELRRAVAEQRPSVFEYYYGRRDRWFENRLYPSADGLSIFFADITDRKHAQERLAAELAGMKRLQEVSTRMVVDGEPNGLLLDIVDAAIAITAADMGNIQLLDRDSNTLRMVASRGLGSPFLKFFDAVQEDHAASDEAMRIGERVIVADVATSPEFAGTEARQVLLAAGVRAVQCTPLVSRAGRLVGMLCTHYRAPSRPADRDLHILDLLARQAADWIERSRSEEALRESEERFRNMADNAPVMIWVTDSAGETIYLSERWCRFTGMAFEEGLGYGWVDSIHPDDRHAAVASFRAANASHTLFRVEYRLRRHDGEYRWAIDAAAPRFGPAGEFLGYIGSVLDVTDEKRAEQQIRAARDELDVRVRERTAELSDALASLERQDRDRKDLLLRIVTVQEEERRRISRELHDQMGQHLAALSLRLKLAMDAAREDAPVREQLVRLEEYTGHIGTEVHRIALELRPAALDDLGLVAALTHHAAEWSTRSGVHAEVRSSGRGAERMPQLIETTIYRTVQEAMTNVARHAEASRVIVTFNRLRDYVAVIVEDDGKGFDEGSATNPPSSRQRLGLLGMRERVALVGGRLEIESSPGAGTTVLIRIPIAEAGEVEGHG